MLLTEIIKKANKRIYFIVQLNRAKVPHKEIVIFYTAHVLGPYLSIPVKCFISLYLFTLRPISTQENKHGIGPDRTKIELAHGFSVPIFCSSLNL